MGLDEARRMPWEAFKAKFLEKYFPEEERDQQEREFLSLVQGTWTVRDYVMQFKRLSHFAHHIVDTPQKKVKQFHQGLGSHLRHMMVGHLNQSFKGIVRLASSLERIANKYKDKK